LTCSVPLGVEARTPTTRPFSRDHVVRCRLHHKKKGRLLLWLSREHAQ
jgi:hypothetical protein